MRSSVRTARPTDRLSWLWLAIGGALVPFSSIQPSLPFAAWLAPIFFLRFARTQRLRVSLPAIALIQSAGLFVNWYIGTNTMLLAISGIVLALLYTLSYLVDRLLAPRLAGLTRTLVFPVAATAIDWLGSTIGGAVSGFLLPSLFTAAAAWDSPAYTQAGNMSLLQIVSVTGIWGLTFLMAWSASVVNELWEHHFHWQPARASVAGLGAMLAVVLLFGGARIAFFPMRSAAVRVAGIVSREDQFSTIMDMNPRDLMPGTGAMRAVARERFAPILDDLLTRTEREARSGAKIIVWGEAAAPVLQEDVAAVVERAGRVAREQQVYLQLGLVTFRRSDQFPFMENRALLIEPSGVIVWDYHKAYPTPGENMSVAAGPRILPIVDTPYGRLAPAICYDMDFPALIRQAGTQHVDIVLAPYKDWKQVAAQHAQMATLRAIENGVSVVRPSLSGLSTVVDPEGHVLAEVDTFTTDAPTIVAMVPIKGRPTLYARIGDSFAYLCVAGLMVLAGAALTRRNVGPVIVPQPAGL